jgi:CheY-like chemotaxis protein
MLIELDTATFDLQRNDRFLHRLMVATLLLEKLGIRPDLAANGREAVQMFELVPYDLIFMDCQMAEMDGFVASRQIRLGETDGRRVAIIAMTAEAMAGSREAFVFDPHGCPFLAGEGGSPFTSLHMS